MQLLKRYGKHIENYIEEREKHRIEKSKRHNDHDNVKITINSGERRHRSTQPKHHDDQKETRDQILRRQLRETMVKFNEVSKLQESDSGVCNPDQLSP